MNNTTTLKLATLGPYYRPLKNDFVNLKQYFIDKNNNLYSMNLDTWELDRKKGKDILKCSNDCLSRDGLEIVNSLRAMNRKKVTIRRSSFDFHTQSILHGTVELEVTETTPRHLKILSKSNG